MLLKTIFALSAALLVTVGCGSSDKNMAAAPTEQQKAISQLDVSRNEYVNTTQSRIDKMAAFGTDLKTKANAAGKVRAKKMQNASEDLSSLLEDARMQLTEVRTAAPENWMDEKRDVESAMSRAETQYSNSVQLLR